MTRVSMLSASSYTDRYAFPTTAISTVIIGEGRKKEFAWVFQRYDAYTAFNLLEKDLSRSSPPLRCFNLVLDTSLIYLNWPSIEWHRTIRVFSSFFTNSVSRDFQADREIEIFVYLRTFTRSPSVWNWLNDVGYVEIRFRVLKNGNVR